VLAQATGVFAEPAAAAAYVGLAQAVTDGLVEPDERIIVLCTGSGLKDVASARRSVGEPFVVDANLPAVEQTLKQDSRL